MSFFHWFMSSCVWKWQSWGQPHEGRWSESPVLSGASGIRVCASVAVRLRPLFGQLFRTKAATRVCARSAFGANPRLRPDRAVDSGHRASCGCPHDCQYHTKLDMNVWRADTTRAARPVRQFFVELMNP